jgi:hypothetical protein
MTTIPIDTLEVNSNSSSHLQATHQLECHLLNPLQHPQSPAEQIHMQPMVAIRTICRFGMQQWHNSNRVKVQVSSARFAWI